MADKRENKGVSPALIVTAAAALLLGGGIFAVAKLGGGGNTVTELTPEAKAYTRNLRLADVGIKATESYVGQAVVEITGKVTNAGDRPVQQVDLMCVFYSPVQQVVARERVSIVRARHGGLKPGETKDFRLPFDNLPQTWNQSMPQMVIAGIVF
jgi:hypothetical protein